MQPQNIVIASNYFVLNIQQLLVTYPPSTHGLYFPYTLESLVSKCVKLAANPTDPETESSFIEIKTNISSFDPGLNENLMVLIRTFVQYLVQTFRRFSWYSNDGTSPLRFVGFTEGSFDLEVRSG
jgi:hypothetical protein